MKKTNLKGRSGVPASSGRWKLLARLAAAVVVAVCAFHFLYPARSLFADTFGWTQADWSGGADASAGATYTDDRTTWTKYHSKTGNVTAGASGAVLSQAGSSYSQTAAADYEANTLDSNMRVDAPNAKMTLKRANGRVCASDAECVEAYCLNSICTDNPWVYGICSGIGVYPSDAGTFQWKTSSTFCSGSAQCPSGFFLTADNSVDFSAYPARNACKSVGGRLPTQAELSCIHSNRAQFSGFTFNNYWWNQEVSTYGYNAYYLVFSTGGSNTNSKTNSYYVRCVRDAG